MSFAVVIPSKTIWNLTRCVAAVHDCEYNALPIPVIVIDDGVDWTPPRPFYERAFIDVLEGEKPFIFARNVNLGIREAFKDSACRGVVLLNDDALLTQAGGFSLLAGTCDAHPEIGVIGCTTNLGHSCQKPKGVGLRIVDHFAFVAVYIPRRTIETVGYLDERFTAYGYEDNDYTIRVRQAGLQCAVHDGCYVDHGSLRSTFRGDPKTPAQLSEGRKIFLEKWPGAPV